MPPSRMCPCAAMIAEKKNKSYSKTLAAMPSELLPTTLSHHMPQRKQISSPPASTHPLPTPSTSPTPRAGSLPFINNSLHLSRFFPVVVVFLSSLFSYTMHYYNNYFKSKKKEDPYFVRAIHDCAYTYRISSKKFGISNFLASLRTKGVDNL